jgi:O-antigen ligase
MIRSGDLVAGLLWLIIGTLPLWYVSFESPVHAQVVFAITVAGFVAALRIIAGVPSAGRVLRDFWSIHLFVLWSLASLTLPWAITTKGAVANLALIEVSILGAVFARRGARVIRDYQLGKACIIGLSAGLMMVVCSAFLRYGVSMSSRQDAVAGLTPSVIGFAGGVSGLIALAGARYEGRVVIRVVWLGVAGLALSALWLSANKGGLAAFVLAVLVMSVFQLSGLWRRAALAAILIAAVSGAVVFSLYWADIAESLPSDVTTLTGRTILWEYVIAESAGSASRLILGFGYSASQVLLDDLGLRVFGVGFRHSHNLVLEALLNGGLVGVALLVGSFIAIALRISSFLRKHPACQDRVLGELSMAMLVFLLVRGFVEGGVAQPGSIDLMAFVLLMGLSGLLGRSARMGRWVLLKGSG